MKRLAQWPVLITLDLGGYTGFVSFTPQTPPQKTNYVMACRHVATLCRPEADKTN